MHTRIKSLRPGVVPALFLACAAVAIFAAQAKAQSLGSAETFGVLAATTVTNTGSSVITGDVGVAPGSAITGFPPGIIFNGTIHANDGPANAAHADLATAYTQFATLVSPPANNLTGSDLGGMTLSPGVYRFDTEASSGGILTFDAKGDPNARFVIQIGTTLITTGASSVLLINGADARNVYFLVGSAATLGSGSSFIGNIMAGTSVTAVGGTTVTGRLLALTAAVTLDSNTVTYPGLTVTPTPTPIPTPTPGVTPPGISQIINLSTRMRVQTADNVGIGGFIVTGSVPKPVIIRAIGPTLAQHGVVGVLADPKLELHGPGAFVTVTNNDWRETQQTEIQATGIAPTNDLESAIVATLSPGAYTAIVSGNGNTSGIALVEVYDLDQSLDSKLANISTRAFVGTSENIVIAGFLISNRTASDRVVARGIGPSLTAGGVPNALANPTLELHDTNGTLLISNNDWQDNTLQAAEIIAAGLAPKDNLEAAIAATLPPGLYTVLLAGLAETTGIGVAEVYDLGPPPAP
jgi:Ice-binding-like